MSNRDNDNPFASESPYGDPFGQAAQVSTNYEPPQVPSVWGGPAPESAELITPAEESYDDEPFTAAHLAASNVAAVPAVGPAAPKQAAGLAFAASTLPTQNISGKIGGAPGRASPVPRLGGAAGPDSSLLLGAAGAGPSSAPTNGSGGGGGGAGGLEDDPTRYPFYSVKRYRSLFNVDTTEVLARIFRSIVLFFKPDFLEHISANPDLYGPFWVATTLVFVSAATGNYASYLAHERLPPPPAGSGGSTSQVWYYDVDKVGGSMGLFYGYVTVIGLAVFLALRFFQSTVSIAQVWCTYGYALAVYIPMAFVCVFPVESMRWSVVGAATGISGLFILLNLRRPIFEAAGAKALPLFALMAALHVGLGLALKLYFFHYSAV